MTDSFWQLYGNHYNPANARQTWFWALLYAGLSFAASPHWSGYVFAILTTFSTTALIADHFYLRWRFRFRVSHALIDWTVFVQHLHAGELEAAAEYHRGANCTCPGCMGDG